MVRRTLALVVGVAALFVWPSCGPDDSKQERTEAGNHILETLEGTWTGALSTAAGASTVTLTFDPQATPQVEALECVSRGPSLLSPAYACITRYTVAVTGQMDSLDPAYRGAVTATATATGATGEIVLELSTPLKHGFIVDSDKCDGGAIGSLTKS